MGLESVCEQLEQQLAQHLRTLRRSIEHYGGDHVDGLLRDLDLLKPGLFSNILSEGGYADLVAVAQAIGFIQGVATSLDVSAENLANAVDGGPSPD